MKPDCVDLFDEMWKFVSRYKDKPRALLICLKTYVHKFYTFGECPKSTTIDFPRIVFWNVPDVDDIWQ